MTQETEPFFEAIKDGNKFRLERILSVSPNLINTRAPGGWSPLRLAIRCNQLSVAKLLVSKGAQLQT